MRGITTQLAARRGERPQRSKPALPARLLVLALPLLHCPAAQAQCDALKSGDRLWVRLLQPLSSYSSKAGETVKAMVIDSTACQGAETIAAGTVVEGEIKHVRRLGMGLLHETAALEVEFQRLVAADGTATPVASRVLEIDNAREKVKNGVIRGVSATDTPQGRITGRLAHLPEWDPYSHVAVLAYRAVFPFFPEPEIYLPRGTNLKLELTADLIVPEQARGVAPTAAPDEIPRTVLELTAADLPERTTTQRARPADIVNLVLLGTREQMDAAFRAAGWTNSAPTTTKSVWREMHAIMTFQNYPQLPMSTQLLDGQSVATTWEKGLDSYQKREHLRVWARNDVIEGQTVWLAAMTRETGAGLSLRQHRFIHHIDADLDAGREIVARDLALAGCVASSYALQRPQAEHAAINATGDPMWTDGSLTVIQLKDCEHPVFERNAETPEIATRPHSKLARYLRMQMLNIKTDLVRGNIVYGTFDLTRMLIRARRNHAQKTLLTRQAESKGQERAGIVMGDTDSPLSTSFVNGDD